LCFFCVHYCWGPPSKRAADGGSDQAVRDIRKKGEWASRGSASRTVIPPVWWYVTVGNTMARGKKGERGGRVGARAKRGRYGGEKHFTEVSEKLGTPQRIA